MIDIYEFQGGIMFYPQIRTGDILVREGNAKGPLGLPFSKIVKFLTKSKYSHSAMAFIEFGAVYVLETNEKGTYKCSLQEWVDSSKDKKYAIYRFLTINQRKALEEIHKQLKKAPAYDFTFSDRNKYYCVEMVVDILKKAEVKVAPPLYAKDILPFWLFPIAFIINLIVKLITGDGFPTNKKLYFVGNNKHGLLSSKNIYLFADMT